MYREFEMRWDGDLDGTPEQVWDAITRRTAAWMWPVEYEPRVGGAETGLAGGTVTTWEPPRRFVTRAEGEDGFFNELAYTLVPTAAGTRLGFVHRGVAETAAYDAEVAACEAHTAFYYHSLTQYVRHFAGRAAEYVSAETPDGRQRLGVAPDAQVGDRVTVAGADGVVDYASEHFLGVRTQDTLIRVYDRSAWGMPSDLAHHRFA
jgi:hypothetical protein